MSLNWHHFELFADELEGEINATLIERKWSILNELQDVMEQRSRA